MFERQLEQAIADESRKLILRYHAYHNALEIEHQRNRKRIRDAKKKRVFKPDYWDEDPKFNPFYVYRKSKSIARAIADSIRKGAYSPKAPFTKLIPKEDGRHREISVYQIPDAAVSRWYYERLLRKNKHRFSRFSYAYRDDTNIHFAIQDIAIDLTREARCFIAEYDFSDFFGSIDHTYLKKQFDANGFFVSDEEQAVISAFLNGRDKGIPQGTSISLFLANLVCWKLDTQLERSGLKFARYADDTVIWSSDYGKICNAASIVNEFSSSARVGINEDKSRGISLLTTKGLKGELVNTRTFFEFLGYSLSVDSVSIKSASVRKIKRQISYLIYKNLIQPLQGEDLRGLIIPANDRDRALLTALAQVRRYLYGGLTDQQIRNYISGRSNRIFFKGIMSYYPLVSDERQLRNLDGWLVSVLYRAIQKRKRLLAHWGYDRSGMFPFNVPRGDLADVFREHRVSGRGTMEVPSFLLIWRALSIGVRNRGIASVMNARQKDYDY